MTSIPLPQSPSDSRQVARSLDENGNLVFGQVGFQELDFGAVFGGKTTSTSQNTIDYGLQTFTLDIDDGKIIRGCKVEITSLDDTDCWEIGIVASKDLTVSPAAVTVFIKKISPLTNTSKNWEIQIVDDAAANVATLGYSADSKQFGSSHDIFVGATVSVTTDAGKLFNSNSHIVFEALSDGTQYFRGISQAYNTSTGALSVFVTDVSSTSGTYTAWALSAQDGPAANAALTATSTTSITIATGMSDFVTQSGKGFVSDGFMFAFDATNSANFIFGVINNYSGTALRLRGIQTGGSGTIANWSLISIIGPLGNAGNGQGIAAAFNHDQLQLYNTAQDHTLVLSNASTGSSIINLDGQSGTRTVTLKGNPTLGTTDFAIEAASTLMGRGSASGSGATQAINLGTGLSMAGTTLSIPSATLAIYSATVTPQALGINASAVNATTDVATFTAHGRSAGESVVLTGAVAAGLTTGQPYYLGVVDANNVTFHLTLAAALAGTSKVDITATTTGWSFRYYALSSVRNDGTIGLASVGGFAFAPGGGTIHPEYNLASAPSSVPVVRANCAGLVDTVGASPPLYVFAQPTLSNSNQTITYPSGAISTLRTTPAVSNLGTYASQGNTAFTVDLVVW